MIPSPKRRKVGHEDEDPGVYHKRSGYYENRGGYTRGLSRSPSPPKSDKERYGGGREYYTEREFPKTHSYGEREREPEHRFYREQPYNRGPRNGTWERSAPQPNSMGSSNHKYEYGNGRYYDNGGYRKDHEEYPRGRSRGYQREERPYDRERYNERDYGDKSRDPYPRYDYERDSRERGDYTYRDNFRDKYYSPRSPTRENRENYSPRDDGEKKEKEEGQITPSPEVGSQLPSISGLRDDKAQPQPRKTLSWGQGLMSTVKKEEPKKEEDSNKSSPTLGEQSNDQSKAEPTPPGNEISTEIIVDESSMANDDVNMEVEYPESKEEVKEEDEGPICEFPSLPSKEEVLLSIERLDAEITKTDILIHNLKKPKKTRTQT